MHKTDGPGASRGPTGSDLRGRLLKGIGAQGFSQAAQILIRLAEVPLLLSFWGTQLYGEWLMLSAIPIYLSVGDGGFVAAACREITIRSGAGNRKGTMAVFQSTWILLIVVSLATSLLAFGFVQVAPLEDWLGFSSMTALEIRMTLLLLVAFVLAGFQGGLLNGGFWVAGRYSISMYFIAVMQVLEFGGLATAVSLGGGPVQAACGYLSGRLIGIGLMGLGQRRVTPWLKHGLSYASLTELRRLAIPAFASLAFPLGNALNIQGMRLVVGLVLGPSAVALFAPLRTLSRLAMQPATIINRLIEPELALAYGAKNNSLLQRLFVTSCRLALWGCLGACLLMGPGAYWIFPAWTGGRVTIQWATYLVLLGGVVINSIWYTALMVPYAINRHGPIAFYYALLYGAATVGLGFLGANGSGLNGVALVLLLAEAAMSVLILRTSLQITGICLSRWAESVVRPPFDLLRQVAVAVRIIGPDRWGAGGQNERNGTHGSGAVRQAHVSLKSTATTNSVKPCLDILYLGQNFGTSLHRANALKRLGHNVDVLNPWNFFPGSGILKGVLKKLTYEIGPAFLEPYVQKKLKNRLRHRHFDVIWCNQCELIGSASALRLRKHAPSMVTYVNDDPFGPRDKKLFSLFRQSVPHYDLSVVVRWPNLSEFYGNGASKVIRVFMSADEIAHRPLAMTPEEKRQWGSDVVFIGTWMPERGPFLARLMGLGIPLTLYGDRWRKAREWPVLKKAWRGPGLVGDTYVKAIQAAKVCIGLVSKDNRDLHTSRSAEIPYIGSVLCAERTMEHMTMYREDKEVVLWSTPEECAEKCTGLLFNETRRNNIAEAGRRRCITGGYLNEPIMETIINTLVRRKPETSHSLSRMEHTLS